MNNFNTYIVIGASAAGVSAVRTLRARNPHSRIICFSDETCAPYNKCLLAGVVAGEYTLEQTQLFKDGEADSLAIELRLGDKITNIDASHCTVTNSQGKKFFYDALLIATGAKPIAVPSLGSIPEKFTTTFYRAHDAITLQEGFAVVNDHKILVMGGGLNGLEVADALFQRGVRLMVAERLPCLFAGIGDQRLSKLLHDKMEGYGVELVCNTTADAFQCTSDNGISIQFGDGRSLCVNQIVAAIGLQSNDELAQCAGIITDQYGIVVDLYMRTNIHNVFAAGDVISVTDRLTGSTMRSCTWPDAVYQGRLAALNMLGGQETYAGPQLISQSSFFGFKIARAGFVTACSRAGLREIVCTHDHLYEKYMVDEYDCVHGFFLCGIDIPLTRAKRALLTQSPLQK